MSIALHYRIPYPRPVFVHAKPRPGTQYHFSEEAEEGEAGAPTGRDNG